LKCTDCGTENPEDAQFCLECGSKLEKPQKISKDTPIKDKDSEKKVGWWKRQTQTSKILLISIPIILIILIAASASLLNSDTKSFSENGIYFSYPSNWTEKQPAYAVTLDTVAYVYDPNDNSTVFTVRKLGINLASLSDAVNQFYSSNQNSTNVFSHISDKPVTINGLNGHEFIYTIKYTYGLGSETKDKAVIIEKTPGQTYYFLIGETPTQKYDELQPTFDKIINSFKVQ